MDDVWAGYFASEFDRDPQEFLGEIGQLPHKDGGWLAALELIEAGLIHAAEFDAEAAPWLQAAAANLRNETDEAKRKALGCAIEAVLSIVTLGKNGLGEFPKSKEALQELALRLLAITIEDGTGHWENEFKPVLREIFRIPDAEGYVHLRAAVMAHFTGERPADIYAYLQPSSNSCLMNGIRLKSQWRDADYIHVNDVQELARRIREQLGARNVTD